MSPPYPLSLADPSAAYRCSPFLDQLFPRLDPVAVPPVLANPFQSRSQPEPSYHPQVGPSSPSGPAPTSDPVSRPYGPGEFSSYVEGTQARQLDVDLMRLSFATYANGPQTVDGWTELQPDQLREAGMDPGVLDVPGSQFRAEVFTDGQGNYVLAYRGTQEGGPDWETNFRQSTGLYTDEFDRLAPQAAQEFKRAFGEYSADANGNQVVNNLVITGHSQGGGLASVGSLLTGIPAVTFDASGVHPVTMDRLNIDPTQARQQAEDGQIRRYSMHEDLLTQAQESYLATGLLAPDALGHQIVVKPEGQLDQDAVARALRYAGMSPEDAQRWGNVVNDTSAVADPLSNINPVLGFPFQVVDAVRGIGRAAISHDQQFMIDTLQQQQPWQPGYTNPSDSGRTLFDLVPQSVEDAAQRGLHRGALVYDGIPEFQDRLARNDVQFQQNETTIAQRGTTSTTADVDATLAQRDRDIRQVIDTDLVQGDTIEAGWSIYGDNARADLQVSGDRISNDADTTAAQWRNDADHAGADVRAFGDLVRPIGLEGAANTVASVIEGGGDVAADVVEFGGGAVEFLADGAGTVVEATSDLIGDAGQAVNDTGEAIADGARWLNDKMPWN